MIKKVLSSLTISVIFVLSGCTTKEDVSAKDLQQKSSSTNFATISQDNMQSDGTLGQIYSNIQPVYFDYDQFVIKSDQAQIIKTNASIIKSNQNNLPKVQLQGNCDDRGTQEYNMALGLKRANAVKTELEQYGISVSKLSVVSFGKDNPVCQTNDEECWAKNRRVDFNLVK
jgi:peptidoglycan-associated lipoprotein